MVELSLGARTRLEDGVEAVEDAKRAEVAPVVAVAQAAASEVERPAAERRRAVAGAASASAASQPLTAVALAADAKRLEIADGEPVIVRSDFGELHGVAFFAPIAAGNVEVHWPEANVLLERDRLSPQARIPDYNARVTLEPSARA